MAPNIKPAPKHTTIINANGRFTVTQYNFTVTKEAFKAANAKQMMINNKYIKRINRRINRFPIHQLKLILKRYDKRCKSFHKY